MYDPNSSYNTAIASQIVECIAACVKTKGLQSALEDFEGMQNILSSLHIWNLVKQGADAIFADERKRLYSSLTQVYNAQKPQSWRSRIDDIFR